MADTVARFRPTRSGIFAFAPSDETVRHLSLNWGTHALKMEFHTDQEETFADAALTHVFVLLSKTLHP